MDWSLALIALALVLVMTASHRETTSRIARIEHKVNLLLRHSGIDLGAAMPLSDRVKDIARDPARKIEAIKIHREETGAGLAAAKEAIDAYIDAQ